VAENFNLTWTYMLCIRADGTHHMST